MLYRLSPERIAVDVAAGRARAGGQQRVPARGRLGRRLGAVGWRWRPARAWRSATGSGSASGGRSARPGRASAWALRSARRSRSSSGVAAAVGRGRRGGLDLAPRTAAGRRRPGRAAVRVSAAVGDHEPTDRRKATDQEPGRTRRSPGSRSRAARDSARAWLGHVERAAQVARAVDVSARQADELLLAERLGHRLAQGRAAVGRIGRLDGEPSRSPSSIDPQERADPRVRRRSSSTGSRPRVSVRPRRLVVGIVDPDGMRLLGPSPDRRARALRVPPVGGTARSLVPFACCRDAQGRC